MAKQQRPHTSGPSKASVLSSQGTLQRAPGEELAPLLCPSLSEADLQEEGALRAKLRVLRASKLIELLSKAINTYLRKSSLASFQAGSASFPSRLHFLKGSQLVGD